MGDMRNAYILTMKPQLDKKGDLGTDMDPLFGPVVRVPG
jgi:hypothetical protein